MQNPDGPEQRHAAFEEQSEREWDDLLATEQYEEESLDEYLIAEELAEEQAELQWMEAV